MLEEALEVGAEEVVKGCKHYLEDRSFALETRREAADTSSRHDKASQPRIRSGVGSSK